MKFPRHMVITISVAAILVCFLGSDVIAQAYAPGGPPPGFYYQPPSMAPTGPSMYPGAFYISGGVRYYNANGFRFNKPQEQLFVGNNGTPPFGPDDGIPPNQPTFGTPITFGTGTMRTGLQAFPLPPVINYNPAGDPRTSGIWIYQNGAVNSSDPGFPPPATCSTLAPPPPTTFCPGGHSNWPDPAFPNEILGRFPRTPLGGAADCCVTTTVNENAGSFQFEDPFSQTDNPGSIAGTTAISFQWIIDGTYNAKTGAASGEVASLIMDISAGVFDNEVFKAQVWGPSIEIGYQSTSLFDIYLGFSGYQTGQAFTKSFNYQAGMARRAFIDTFSFGGVQAVAWPVAPFDSGHTIVSGDPVQQYQIAFDGKFRNRFPTRTFFLVGDPTVPVENLQEDVTNKSDINLLEFRWAGRTWVPLWGMGRFGFSLGAIGNAINYKISGARTITSLGPNLTGQVVFSETGNVDAWIANYGGFFGTDVELGVRNFFFKASGDWHFIVPKFTYQLLSIETEFDPTGFSLGLYGGIRF